MMGTNKFHMQKKGGSKGPIMACKEDSTKLNGGKVHDFWSTDGHISEWVLHPVCCDST